MDTIGFVYILQSLINSSYYIGSTTNVDRRLKEHNSGNTTSTKYIAPLKLVFSQKFDSTSVAHKVELWLKKQHSRKLLDQIIATGHINKTNW